METDKELTRSRARSVFLEYYSVFVDSCRSPVNHFTVYLYGISENLLVARKPS